MKRKLIGSLLLAVPLAIVVGCSGSSTSSKPVAEGSGGFKSADKDKKIVSQTGGPDAIKPPP
jgi:hypothetical protein